MTHLKQRGIDVSGELWSALILKDRPEEVSVDGLVKTNSGTDTEQATVMAEKLLRISVRVAGSRIRRTSKSTSTERSRCNSTMNATAR